MEVEVLMPGIPAAGRDFPELNCVVSIHSHSPLALTDRVAIRDINEAVRLGHRDNCVEAMNRPESNLRGSMCSQDKEMMFP